MSQSQTRRHALGSYLGRGFSKLGVRRHSREHSVEHQPQAVDQTSIVGKSHSSEGTIPQIVFSLWSELSDGPDEPGEGHKQALSLLRMPYEVLEEIFTYVIGWQRLHLVETATGIGYILCAQKYQDGDDLEWYMRRCHRNCASPLWRYASYGSKTTYERSSQLPPLLFACRQTYVQGLRVLYSSNMFQAEYPEEVVSLAATIPPTLLQSIRFLHINGRGRIMSSSQEIDRDWDDMWVIIVTKMRGLRSLRIDISIQVKTPFDPMYPWSDEAQMMLNLWLLGAVYYLRGFKDFDLVIDTPVDDDRLYLFKDQLRALVCSRILPIGIPKGFPEVVSEMRDGVSVIMFERD